MSTRDEIEIALDWMKSQKDLVESFRSALRDLPEDYDLDEEHPARDRYFKLQDELDRRFKDKFPMMHPYDRVQIKDRFFESTIRSQI